MRATLRLLVVLLITGGHGLMAATEPSLDFNRDVRPILAQHCFHCHGQDPKERKAKLRLDEPGSATALRDGHAAIVPGKLGESELVKRLHTSDPDDLMPPPKAKRPLSPKQMTVLER
ncbi:MAG TPA: c-type cytochrome domain-containing protein [Planctomycetota bacterium]|nr:c-type cytochrome domain-containing protein [Planctomycetota bacterium]